MTSRHHLGTGRGEALTYEGYLRVGELIRLQTCLSKPRHHDELLFIITHQAFELWFKLILFEIDAARAAMDRDDVRGALYMLRRVVEIERLLVVQIHLMETMSPQEFLAFREGLNPASGFQSIQFRELEFVSGLKSESILDEFDDDDVTTRLRARLQAPDLPDCLRALLRRRGVVQPEGSGPADVEARVDALAALYRAPGENGDLVELAEVLISHDEQIQLWRYHHLRMVERMIGFKRGTGGSEGVAYLETTLGRKCFPDLWALRTRLEAPA